MIVAALIAPPPGKSGGLRLSRLTQSKRPNTCYHKSGDWCGGIDTRGGMQRWSVGPGLRLHTGAFFYGLFFCFGGFSANLKRINDDY